MPDFSAIRAKAARMRIDIVEMIAEAGSGHPGGSLSAADIVATLYFGDVLRYDASQPQWPDRDRFILSKGHAGPVLYAALAEAGYFGRDHLTTLRKLGSMLQGHPDSRKTPGVEVSTGSLGQGLSIASGLACRPAWRRGAGAVARRPHRVLPHGRRRAAGGPGLGGRDVRRPRGPLQPRRDRRPQRPSDRRGLHRGHVPRHRRRQVPRVRLARHRGRRARRRGRLRRAGRGQGLRRRPGGHRRPHDQGQGRLVHGRRRRLARQGTLGRAGSHRRRGTRLR